MVYAEAVRALVSPPKGSRPVFRVQRNKKEVSVLVKSWVVVVVSVVVMVVWLVVLVLSLESAL